ncbi:hypothetical protein FIBSPDRAFT_1037637 [Athelia psychrophila]|uniref:Uncharacterized protein n=1 Tax=Athelia psychrophila TaxID=1759441 RepID=A0A166TZY2_9AGAM|nr:hypothetical protein FIBSPDRAFT_1037637 [Fibularhizoctonia sp. CBS 109695]
MHTANADSYIHASVITCMSMQSLTDDLRQMFLAHSELDTVDNSLLDAFQNQCRTSSPAVAHNEAASSVKSTKHHRLCMHPKQSRLDSRNALGLYSLSKARAESLREQTLSMIYTNISPWPDSVWIGIMAKHALRDQADIQMWFETRRATERINPKYLFQTPCGDRTVYLQFAARQAITHWTDETFEELLLCHGQKRRMLWGADWLLDKI